MVILAVLDQPACAQKSKQPLLWKTGEDRVDRTSLLPGSSPYALRNDLTNGELYSIPTIAKPRQMEHFSPLLAAVPPLFRLRLPRVKRNQLYAKWIGIRLRARLWRRKFR